MPGWSGLWRHGQLRRRETIAPSETFLNSRGEGLPARPPPGCFYCGGGGGRRTYVSPKKSFKKIWYTIIEIINAEASFESTSPSHNNLLLILFDHSLFVPFKIKQLWILLVLEQLFHDFRHERDKLEEQVLTSAPIGAWKCKFPPF